MKYNIYLRKDGRYEGRISRGVTDGRRTYQYFFGRSKEEVMKRMNAFRMESAQYEICEVTLADLFHEWFEQIRYRIKESTAANYRMKANKHILPAFGELHICDISSEDICRFIGQKQTDGLSDRYVSDILVLLRALYKYAVSRYHIYNPLDDIRMSKKKKTEIRLLDAEEQHALEHYCDRNQTLTTLGITVCRKMGLRIGELCALQWSDVNLKKRILTVRKTIQRIQCADGSKKTKIVVTEPKTESSKRKLPIPECLMELLLSFRDKDECYLLSGSAKPIEPRTMQYRFARILKNAALPSVHFHSLRHSFASECIRLGFDVKSLSELLGHGNVEITLNRYVHSSFEQKREYMNRI